MRRTAHLFSGLVLAAFASMPANAWAQLSPPPSGQPPQPSPYGQPPPPSPYAPQPSPYAQPYAAPIRPAPAREPESSFYGWEIFPGALLAGGLFVLGRSTEGGDGRFVVYTSAAVIGLAWGPVIHAFNDQSSKMKSSMELTVAGATLGLMIGSIVTSQQKPEDREYGKNILTGIEIGVVSAMLLDGLVFGWKESFGGMGSVHPTVAVTKDRTTFGLAGAF